MKKKEKIHNRYSVIEGNPLRHERLQALLSGKIIKIESYRTDYFKFDKYQRLCFSNSEHESSFHPYQNGYDYEPVLDDKDETSGSKRIITILF